MSPRRPDRPSLPMLPDGTPAGWYGDPASVLLDRYWNGYRWTEETRSGLKQVAPEELDEQGAAQVADTAHRAVLVATAEHVAGHRTVAHVGEVFGITVQSRNAISDLGASVRSFVGGEVGGYVKMLATARREALTRLRQEAHALGANAVVSMRLTSTSLTDGVTEVVAYGTAVRVVADAGAPENEA